MKPRESRRNVMIASRMRSDTAWVDVNILNVSSRGLLVTADAPPPLGAYVDIRRGTCIIIGRVVWSDGQLFGIRTQDRLDIDALINEPRLVGPPRLSEGKNSPASDRRSANRAAQDVNIAHRLERSRQLSAAFQFGLIVIGGAAVAGLVAAEVYAVLQTPFAEITSKLSNVS